jgi:hypothetical protein
MKAMFGPEGMTERIAYLKGYVVQTTGGGRTAMSAVLKTLTGTEAVKNPALAATRKELAGKSNFAFYFDLPGFATKAIKLALSTGQVPIPLTEDVIDDLGIKTSYFGCSVACAPRGMHSKCSVPVQQIQGTYKLVRMVIEMFKAPAF